MRHALDHHVAVAHNLAAGVGWGKGVTTKGAQGSLQKNMKRVGCTNGECAEARCVREGVGGRMANCTTIGAAQ